MKKFALVFLLASLFAFALPSGLSAGRADASSLDPFSLLSQVEELSEIDVREEYRLERTLDVAYGTVYRFARTVGGQNVLGGEMILSVGKDGKLLFHNGEYLPANGLKKNLSEEDAHRIAGEHVCGTGVGTPCVYGYGERAEYAYAYETEEDTAYVSAEDGRVLAEIPRSPFAMLELNDASGERVKVPVQERNGVYYLADGTRNIYTLDGRNGNREYSSLDASFEALAVSAYSNVVRAYDFYTEANIGATVRGIDGRNDETADNRAERNEIPLYLVVHYGNRYENAFFTYDAQRRNAYIEIGDGKEDGSIYLPAKAADVIAHEYQHGITHFAAGLVYLNDSGALDEAFSDIFGSLVEGYALDDEEDRFWRIGEDAVSTASELRSMKAPANGQRRTMAERYPACRLNHDHETCDSGGVHFNSTIPTYMQYRLWKRMPEFFTRERIGTLWYSTLCTLTSDATFAEFGGKFLESAAALGYGEEVCTAIREELYESGILTRGSSNDYCLVKFADADGSTLSVAAVKLYDSVTPPADPVRAPTEQYTYEFAGWDRDADAIVTGDTVITARYRETLRRYTVKFFDGEGNLLKTEEVPYGGTASPPEAPALAPTDDSEFTFLGWGDLTVTGEREYHARYEQTARSFEIVFYVNGEATVERGKYGDDLALPALEDTETASFGGWFTDEACTQAAEAGTLTGDAVFYAKWIEKDAEDPFPVLPVAVGGTVAAGGAVAAAGFSIVRIRRKRR